MIEGVVREAEIAALEAEIEGEVETEIEEDLHSAIFHFVKNVSSGHLPLMVRHFTRLKATRFIW